VVLATGVFLFNLDMGELWPLFFILVGLGAIINSLHRGA
jgi:hypothetical protein